MIPLHLQNPGLKERLGAFSGKRVFFFPTPGNAGDSLVQAVTYGLFEELGIKFEIMTPDIDVSGQPLIVGGGGNLVPAYGAVRKIMQNAHYKASELILLPHTIRGNEDLIREFGGNVEIYCRDVVSYEQVLRHRSSARAALAHDMSFGVNVAALERVAGERAEALLNARLDTAPIEKLAAESGVRFFFFLGDAKQTLRLTPKSNSDPALTLKTGVLPGDAEVGALALIRYLAKAREIHTNRVQVALAATILGKRVYLYDNALGQSEGVYRHSIHADFRKAQFIP
jgi:exopolysaccharide biosynthesis predicted pyruvyltransferase EpsI